jgi:hypothetical protein
VKRGAREHTAQMTRSGCWRLWLLVSCALLLLVHIAQRARERNRERDELTLAAIRGVRPIAAVTLNDTLGAFLPCYNQIAASAEALRRFRVFNPRGNILMQSDAGLPELAQVALRFNASFRELRRRGTWFVGTIYYDAEPMLKYVDGLVAVSHMQGTEWVQILEDDVWWLRPVPSLQYDLNGAFDPGELSRREQEIVREEIGVSPRAMGGFGGSIYRASILREMGNNPQKVERLVRRVLRVTGWLASDRTMSVLVHCFGGSIGPLPALLNYGDHPVEFEVDAISNGGVAILHHAKFLYL